MRRLLFVVVLLGLAWVILSPLAAAQNCSSPPTGFGGSWWRAYAAWCSACGGTPNSSNTSCTPGPNWGGRASAPPPPPSSQPFFDNEAERQRQEAERKRQEEERLRKEAEEARRKQEEFERNKQDVLRNMKGIAGEFGLKGFDNGDNMGLKGIGDAGAGGFGLKDASDPATAPPLPSSRKPAWDVQITDPQVARLAKSIGTIVPPPPISKEEVPLTWSQIYLNEETLMKTADRLMAAWEMAGPLGSAVSFPLKVIMIGGKTFIAGENGAAVYLVKKDQTYDEALRYLKNPAQSQQFARLVQAIRENRPVPASADPAMVKAARAIADPKLGNSSASVAWDAMISRDALSAMFRKASIEIGSEYLADKTGKLLTHENQRKAVFDALRLERRQAVKMMDLSSTTAAQREQLKIVIDRANRTMADIYRIEKVSDTLRGQVIGDGTDKLAAAFLGPEAKVPEPK